MSCVNGLSQIPLYSLGVWQSVSGTSLNLLVPVPLHCFGLLKSQFMENDKISDREPKYRARACLRCLTLR